MVKTKFRKITIILKQTKILKPKLVQQGFRSYFTQFLWNIER